MVKGNKTSWNWMRVLGVATAAVLITFGGVGNLWRTVRFGLRKLWGDK